MKTREEIEHLLEDLCYWSAIHQSYSPVWGGAGRVEAQKHIDQVKSDILAEFEVLHEGDEDPRDYICDPTW